MVELNDFVFSKGPMKKPSKTFLSILLLGLLTAVWAFLIEPGLLTKRDLKISRWPGPPIRIAFFSDLHAGAPHINEKYINDLIQRINAMSPNLILIGGDLAINGVPGGNPIPIERVASLLKNLKAPLGVYSVLGNHDWWNDGDKISQTLKDNQIQVLENKAQRIHISPNFSFWLVGVGDDFTGHADANAALKQISSEEPTILFMHDPGAIFQVKEKFFLTLAGHMHGGQIYIPGIGALVTPGRAPKEWAGGWVDFELGALFVSKGIGTSIIPVRLNALPEFVILDLQN